MQLIPFRDARAVPSIDNGHGDDHALGKGADRRQEHGRLLQPAVEGHLRQVLMIQVPAVGAPGLVALFFKHGRQLLAASTIPRHGGAGQSRLRFQETGIYKRSGDRNESGSVAARVRHTCGRGYFGALGSIQLGEAVDPRIINSMGRGRVDDLGVRALSELYSFSRGVVR